MKATYRAAPRAYPTRYFGTGATGFIDKWLVKELLAREGRMQNAPCPIPAPITGMRTQASGISPAGPVRGVSFKASST
jgi:hypothetical protein